MTLLEVYTVNGYEKEYFLDNEYKDFEKEISKDELIEMLNNPKIIVNEVKRKVITDKVK